MYYAELFVSLESKDNVTEKEKTQEKIPRKNLNKT